YQDIGAALRLERCRARGVEFNRRSTGGGTVIMGPEIVALGLGINVDHPRLKKGVGGVFQSLSLVLLRALDKIGIQGYFQPKNDLEVNGRKIAGLSAASEADSCLLFHTSLLVDFDVALMTDMIDVIQNSFEEEFSIRFKEDSPDEWEEKTIQGLIDERYTKDEWIFSHRHPRARMGVGQLKTKGGLLEIYLALSGASIESVLVTGDFFSTSEDLHRIENALKWTSARRESIENNIASVWHDNMIYGIDVPTLTKAILLAKENQVRL
ncbi:MAG: hypothetical protein JRF52_14565, partial [Deltaproteobacteria bacterium]|nr:hypothetical protein [Deltaproteobacteria bacterium]